MIIYTVYLQNDMKWAIDITKKTYYLKAFIYN
jgi:hypothetical protein